MTTLKWDHVVQFVNQPDEAIAAFAGHKLSALAGGRHPGWGTWNALSYFGLTYIEFLAIYDRAELASAQADFLLSRDAAQLLPENQALHRVALRTDDIDQTHAELRSKGLNISPIVDGQRNDPQGNIIRWRIFTVDGDFNGLPYPFILQWGEGDDARLTRLRAQGLDGPHPAGEVTLQSAVFAVQDPQAARARWHALFGFNDLPEGLAVGQQRFVFLQGQGNRLVELVFNVSDPALKGQHFRVGNGEYRFQ